MGAYRHDKTEFKAIKTDEGYLVDNPIVGRVGIQRYMLSDGTIRREFRPPEEVFNADSLSTFDGKPLTFGHPEKPVNAQNAKELSIGAIRGDGVKDGDNVRAKIIVLDGESIKKIEQLGIKELSLGYSVTLDETPGIWNGQEYDAIQRDIKINHLAVVEKGRAGNARLNLDRFDAVSFFDEVETMTQVEIRADGGLVYKADKEVAIMLENEQKAKAELSKKLDDVLKRADKAEGERDSLKAEVAKIEQIKKDAFESGAKSEKERAELVVLAKSFNVDAKDMQTRQIKEAVIKTVRVDADLSAKSDDYVNAAFDVVVEMKGDANMQDQRTKTANKNDGNQKETDIYKNFMASLGKKEQK